MDTCVGKDGCKKEGGAQLKRLERWVATGGDCGVDEKRIEGVKEGV